MHDFLIKELGQAVVPYGVYDLATNAGWVGSEPRHGGFCGADHPGEQEIGRSRYRAAPRLTITADGGGSNGVPVRLWKRELQKLCDETPAVVTAGRASDGIAHRLFCRPETRTGEQSLVRLLGDRREGGNTTKTGLSIRLASSTRMAVRRGWLCPMPKLQRSTSSATSSMASGNMRSPPAKPYPDRSRSCTYLLTGPERGRRDGSKAIGHGPGGSLSGLGNRQVGIIQSV